MQLYNHPPSSLEASCLTMKVGVRMGGLLNGCLRLFFTSTFIFIFGYKFACKLRDRINTFSNTNVAGAPKWCSRYHVSQIWGFWCYRAAPFFSTTVTFYISDKFYLTWSNNTCRKSRWPWTNLRHETMWRFFVWLFFFGEQCVSPWCPSIITT